VFAGGCTLEAAEDIAQADLDTLQSLVDKSLLRFADGRFWMLETICEFALERLGELGAVAGYERRTLPPTSRERRPNGPESGQAARTLSATGD
jgi:hypothetical protein